MAQPKKRTASAGRRVNPKASKPKPKAAPTQKRIPSEFGTPQGYQEVERELQLLRQENAAIRRSPAIGAPVHASPSAFGSAQRIQPSAYVGSSAATPQRPSTPAQAALQGAPSSETYRDGGKGLYQGTQAYREAIGGSGNPLLNKLRSDLGRDTATGAKAAPPPTPNPQYEGNDEPGKLGQAEDPMKALAELLNRRKLSITVEN